jgi:hypothetical protein
MTIPQAEQIMRQQDERDTGGGTLKLGSIEEALEYKRRQQGG